jgi:DNA polymerase-3 subunit alpha
VSKSARGFTVEDGGVRFGLLAIKGIGEGPINEILRVREEGGLFTSLADFCTRVDPKAVGKGGIETLIKTGAMDSFGKRHHLLASVEAAMKWGKQARDAQTHGLMSLFDEMDQTEQAFAFTLKTGAEEISRKQLLAWEKELVGIYTSKHPLAYLSDLFKERVTHTTAEITGELDRKKVTIGGTIKEARRITTKKGDTMCVVQLEDMYGMISVTVFPKAYEETTDLWVEDTVVIVHGVVQVRRDEPGILCDRVEQLKAVEEEMNRKRYQVWIKIVLSGSGELAVSDDIMKVQDVYRCLQERPGRDHYEILVESPEWTVRLTPSDDTMYYSKEVHKKLEAFLGEGKVEVRELDILAMSA